MSKTKKRSVLQKSTIITMTVCFIFLLLTATVLLVLMMFPIEPKQEITLQNTLQEQQPTETTAQILAPDEWENTEAPHTLSTWSASIDGFTNPSDDYFHYINIATQGTELTLPIQIQTSRNEPPTENEWTQPPFVENTETTTTTEYVYETTFDRETGYSADESSEYIHSESQTVTETIAPPPTEEEPIITEPLPTEPPQVIVPEVTDPPVIEEGEEGEEV